MKRIVLGLLTSTALWVMNTSAADVEKVRFSAGKVTVSPGETVLMAPKEVKLPADIVVKTNGTFTVRAGKVRQLGEGDSLGADGMLTRPDGTVIPVIDHVAFNRGRVVVVKDGDAAVASQRVTLGDGTSIEPDGKLNPRAGSPRRLLDGEMFKMDGSVLAARDSITLEKGRVKIQKDGSPIYVERGRSVTMNDGTKVLGDGKVIRSNGQELTLTEGQVITLEGVVRKR